MFKKFIRKNNIYGSWITIANEIVAEIILDSNLDFHTIDLEHSSISINQCEQILRLINLKNKPAFVRLSNNEESEIKRVLDAGADGLILPNLRNKDQLDSICNYIFYPPKGKRGVGLSRAQKYGKKFNNYFLNFNKNISIVVIIENIDAINNLEQILSSKKLDAIMIGPYDLSASLGIAGQFQNPKFKKAIKNIVLVAKKYKKNLGIHVVEPDIQLLKKQKKLGFDFIIYSLDTKLLSKSLDEFDLQI